MTSPTCNAIIMQHGGSNPMYREVACVCRYCLTYTGSHPVLWDSPEQSPQPVTCSGCSWKLQFRQPLVEKPMPQGPIHKSPCHGVEMYVVRLLELISPGVYGRLCRCSCGQHYHYHPRTKEMTAIEPKRLRNLLNRRRRIGTTC